MEQPLRRWTRMVDANNPGPFDTTWAGPEELKPRMYRTQTEKDIWYSIAVMNEYRLWELAADDVVIDIGAHVGAFSHLAYRKGSRSIYAFEIDPNHVKAGYTNLVGMEDGVLFHHAAVVRGDMHRKRQYHYAGAWNSFAEVGSPVESISLDEILAPHERVRFLKIDCEGCEFPILYTSTLLHKVDEIAGEYHLVDGTPSELKNLPHPISVEALQDFLVAQGFSVEVVRSTDVNGNFYAKRNAGNNTQELKPSEELRQIADRLAARGL